MSAWSDGNRRISLASLNLNTTVGLLWLRREGEGKERGWETRGKRGRGGGGGEGCNPLGVRAREAEVSLGEMARPCFKSQDAGGKEPEATCLTSVLSSGESKP